MECGLQIFPSESNYSSKINKVSYFGLGPKETTQDALILPWHFNFRKRDFEWWIMFSSLIVCHYMGFSILSGKY